MSKIIIISGPTASGKTQTSINIAKYLQNELNQKVAIVNFDSLLFYKEISIGTAKPTLEEQAGIEHHMLDIESIKSPMNAADFIRRGEIVIEELLAQNKICILVGGSAFYLRALLKGMYESPSVDESIKTLIDEKLKNEGINFFLEYLKQHDPEALTLFHENDHYRITRAVEHHMSTGSPISQEKKKMDNLNPYDFSSITKDWNLLNLYLDLPKEQHYEIIQKRTKQMFKDGLLDEIQKLKLNGFNLAEKPLASIGYKEAIEYLNGQFKSEEDCIERISISTRQLAKSQRTFFNKITPKLIFNPLHDFNDIKRAVLTFIEG